MAGFDFSDFLKIVPDMDNIAAGIKREEAQAVKLAANEYASDVKQVIQYDTGTLRRSIHVETTTEGTSPVAVVGTDVAYSRRLEYGYIATDSLGRTYHQAPAPRWRPTFDNNLRKYEGIIARKLGEGVKK